MHFIHFYQKLELTLAGILYQILPILIIDPIGIFI